MVSFINSSTAFLKVRSYYITYLVIMNSIKKFSQIFFILTSTLTLNKTILAPIKKF